MNSWFFIIIIEEFRTDYLPNENPQNVFMGTIDINGHPLPRLFEPTEITIQPDANYNNQKVLNERVDRMMELFDYDSSKAYGSSNKDMRVNENKCFNDLINHARQLAKDANKEE
jgi:hypothetical protein